MIIEIEFNTYNDLVEIENKLLRSHYRTDSGGICYNNNTRDQIESCITDTTYVVVHVNMEDKHYHVLCYNDYASIRHERIDYNYNKKKVTLLLFKPSYKSRLIIK